MFDKRMIQIVQQLHISNQLTKEELAKKCGLSKRQLGYSLEKINDWLAENGFNPIDFTYYGKIPKDAYDRLKEQVNLATSYLFSKSERKNYLFLLLVTNDDFLSINHFIHDLQVSKSSVMKDLKQLEEELKVHGISLTYSRKDGYLLVGEEGKIRAFLMRTVMGYVSVERNRNMLDIFLEGKGLHTYEQMQQIIQPLVEKHQISFFENRYVEFIYILILLRHRLVQNPSYIAHPISLEKIKATNEFAFLQDVLNATDLPKEASKYVCTWLFSLTEVNLAETKEDVEMILDLVEGMLTHFEVLSQITFEKREEVKQQIFRHFRSTYYRLLFYIPIINPLYERIQKEYGELFTLVKEASSFCAQQLGREIPLDEVSFLTIHFASLIEKYKEKKQIRGVATCPNGYGSSLILHESLKALFPGFLFLEPVANKQIDEALDQVDIVFSSQLLEVGKPCFVVTPIMTAGEKQRLIRDVYTEVGLTFAKVPHLTEMMEVVAHHVTPEQKKAIEKDLFAMFTQENTLHLREKPFLHELIDSRLIQLQKEVKNKYEAVRLAAKPLEEAGMITSEYVEKMLETLKESSSQMVIAKNVALPHTKISYGAKSLGIGITVLQTSVVFGHPQNDPVKYLFCLSTIDKEQHLQALSTLVQLLSHASFYELLDTATDPEAVICFIKGWEQENLMGNE